MKKSSNWHILYILIYFQGYSTKSRPSWCGKCALFFHLQIIKMDCRKNKQNLNTFTIEKKAQIDIFCAFWYIFKATAQKVGPVDVVNVLCFVFHLQIIKMECRKNKQNLNTFTIEEKLKLTYYWRKAQIDIFCTFWYIYKTTAQKIGPVNVVNVLCFSSTYHKDGV